MAEQSQGGNDGGSQEPPNNKDRGSFRSGAFPRLPLRDNMELVKTIYDLGQGDPVRRLTVFDAMKKSPDSGPSRQLLATANGGYGLITGNRESERLGLTQRGTLIASASGHERHAAIWDALFANEIFAGFVSKFAGRAFPHDDVATDLLETTYKLPKDDARKALATFKENLNDYGLVKEYSGRKTILSREAAAEELGATPTAAPSAPPASEPLESTSKPAEQEQDSHVSGRRRERPHDSGPIAPQIHFNIQVQIPDNASAETYDAIFESIAKHLLRRD